MTTGFSGTYVISWAQSALDGHRAGPMRDLVAGATWSWSGDATRVDGPRSVLPLNAPEGAFEIRRRVAVKARRMRAVADVGLCDIDPQQEDTSLFSSTFKVTDGHSVWTVALVPPDAGRGSGRQSALGSGRGSVRAPLLMFSDDRPPHDTDLWVVGVDAAVHHLTMGDAADSRVICFTPGTMIRTPQGLCDVAHLREGDYVQTQDNGPAEILWLGQKEISGARLRVQPDLAPVRVRAGGLGDDLPDSGLLVSPDHRITMRGPRARALFNSDEVLVAARDLINDHSIMRHHGLAQVTYIHLMLPRHEIIFANGVATESFHPVSCGLDGLAESERDRLLRRMPQLRDDLQSYGAFVRPMLTASDAAVLQHDAGRRH